MANAASTALAPPVARFCDQSAVALSNYPQLRAALGDPTLDPELLQLALTHRSFAYEHGGIPTNERLEFLGDSVLGLIITERLYTENPDLAEGKLARLRAAIVNSRALADVARGVGLGEFILLGRGESITGGGDKSSILADTLEAVIGAVHLSGGITESYRFVRWLFAEAVVDVVDRGAGLDWKTSLQELTAARQLGSPEYAISSEGPDHAKVFTAVVLINGEDLGSGVGTSKKIAEQEAAQLAYERLDVESA